MLNAAGVAERTGFRNASVTVTVAVPLAAMVVAVIATVDLAGDGSLATTWTERLRRIRPTESARVARPLALVITPVSVYGAALSGGAQATSALPFASATTRAGRAPIFVEKLTVAPAAGKPVESVTVSGISSCVLPALTVSAASTETTAELMMIGTCGASGLLSGSAIPVIDGESDPVAAALRIAIGPTHGLWNGTPDAE